VEEGPGGRRRCDKALGQPVTRATCCCSVGKAWGPRCEDCPAPESEEYSNLCPGGKGYRPNTVTVSINNFKYKLFILSVIKNFIYFLLDN
jgi:TB domain